MIIYIFYELNVLIIQLLIVNGELLYFIQQQQQMSFHERKTCSSSTIIQRNNTKFPLPLHRRILCDTRFRAVPFSIHPNKTKTYNFNEEKNKKCQTDQTLIIIFYYYINVCVYCRDSRREDVIPHAHCTVSSKCVRIHANKLIFSSSDSAHPTTATQHTHTHTKHYDWIRSLFCICLSLSLWMIYSMMLLTWQEAKSRRSIQTHKHTTATRTTTNTHSMIINETWQNKQHEQTKKTDNREI